MTAMAMPSTNGMPAAWLEERKTYIGASEVAVLTGDSPFQTEYDLWLEKTGQKEPWEGNAITRWGQRIEQVVADVYTEETGRKLKRFGRTVRGQFIPRVVRHKEWPEIACNPDRQEIGGDRRPVQIKSSWNPLPVDAEGRPIIPDHWTEQVQQEMGLLGAEVCDIALATGFAGMRIYEVVRDEAMIRALFAIEHSWWRRHIVDGVEPPRSGRHLRDLRGEAVMTSASALQVDAARAYNELGETAKRLKAQRTNAKEFLQRSLAGARKLNDPAYGLSITWTPWSKTEDVTDWRMVAAAYREAIERELRMVDSGDMSETALPERSDLDAIASLHTAPVTTTGEAWRVTFKDAAPASEEE